MKYILIYTIDDYLDNGGGVQVEVFNNVELLDANVQQIMIDGHNLLYAGELMEYQYKVVEVVKKVVRE